MQNHHTLPLASGQIRQEIRKAMRAKRLALSEFEQTQAAQAILPQSIQLVEQYQAQTLAFYLPFDGEISPLPLMQTLISLGKTAVLPVLHPFSPHALQFFRYRSERDFTPNRFGILEPQRDIRSLVPLDEIEMIFVPLVACDTQHNRLGMGGGFYDRTLSHMPQATTVGLAHRCQQVEKLSTESWDMPLDYLVLG